MLLHSSRRILLFPALVAGLALLPSTAYAAPQESAPCAKLSAHETRFPAGDANRVVFVTATEYGEDTVLITGCVKNAGGYAQEWQQTGFIGVNGFAPEGTLKELQYKSPTGSFSVTEALGLANPGTKLNYHVVNPRSRWGGPGSPSYNSYVESGLRSDENLWYWANQGTYEQAAVINYNRPPDATAVPGDDYAIFFGAGSKVSGGCVSTTLETSTRVVQTFVPGDRIIMGVVNDVFLPAPPSTAAPAPVPTVITTTPPSSASVNVSVAPSSAQSAPVSEASRADLITIGTLLVAAGGAAIWIGVILRRRIKGRHSA